MKFEYLDMFVCKSDIIVKDNITERYKLMKSLNTFISTNNGEFILMSQETEIEKIWIDIVRSINLFAEKSKRKTA